MEGAKELTMHDFFWRHLTPGIHREWTGRRETSTAGEGSPFAAIWSQDMDIMGLLDTCLLAVIVSGFVVVLHQKHSKPLSTASILVVWVVSPKVSPETSWLHFCSPKGHVGWKFSTIPMVFLCCLRFSWLKSELPNWKPSSNVNDSPRRPWIRESCESVVFSRSREFFSNF